MPNQISLFPDDLRKLLCYQEDSGKFIWIKSGLPAGHLRKDGYWSIMIDGTNYMAHRLVWLYHYNMWPSLDIDHINGIREDNRLSNLREVSRSMNLENMKRPKSNNSTGYLGVSKTKEGNYRARISIRGIQKQIGEFKSPEEASKAYLEAKQVYHEGFVGDSTDA